MPGCFVGQVGNPRPIGNRPVATRNVFSTRSRWAFDRAAGFESRLEHSRQTIDSRSCERSCTTGGRTPRVVNCDAPTPPRTPAADPEMVSLQLPHSASVQGVRTRRGANPVQPCRGRGDSALHTRSPSNGGHYRSASRKPELEIASRGDRAAHP